MVSQYLIDTDWIIDALHGQTAAVETLENLVPQGLAVSLISYGELYEGAYWAATNRDAHLEGLHTFLEGKELLPLTVPIMQRFGVLRGELPRHLRQQIGDMTC